VIRFGSVSARLELQLPPRTDDATSITAIHAFGRYAHRAEPEPAPHSPEHVSLQPMAGQVPAAGDRTVVLPGTPAPLRPAASGSGAQEPKATGNRRKGRVILLIVGIGVGLVALAYWLWRR
jgi:hypothetical protein